MQQIILLQGRSLMQNNQNKMEIILLILTIIFFIYGVVVTIVTVNQIKRCNRLEEITNTAVGHLDEIEQLIKSSEELLNNPKLKEAFAHDDEVGGYFKNLEQMQKVLTDYLGGDGQDVQ